MSETIINTIMSFIRIVIVTVSLSLLAVTFTAGYVIGHNSSNTMKVK